ncbi:hypothetical protein CWD94_24515 [Lysinibacillus xylanilyticus]|uniref:Uncharacterized protein n=1 Tax=Lysinibacillus xylanilyticus TaxID=582475 RepID=A0A2M9PZ89_9BACI|nr:hypothetical protein CWD94_24515 [Lysinibacillus xylanilyticus]
MNVLSVTTAVIIIELTVEATIFILLNRKRIGLQKKPIFLRKKKTLFHHVTMNGIESTLLL